MNRRDALRVLLTGGLGAAFGLRLPLTGAEKNPLHIIWHNVPAWVPKGFGPLYVDQCGRKYYEGHEYWAEICGPARPESWGPSTMSRNCRELPPKDDFFGTWVLGVSTYNPGTKEYDAEPKMTCSQCLYRVPGRTWACGEDLTVEPDLSDPVWRARVSLALRMCVEPRNFATCPYPKSA